MTSLMRWACACVLAWGAAGATAAAADTTVVQQGQSVAAALDALRAQGLDITWSDRLVPPQLLVQAPPEAGSPEELARRILEPNGLTLAVIRPGRYAVVRMRSGARARAQPAVPGAGAGISDESLEIVTIFASRYRIDSVGLGTPAALDRADIEVLPGLDEDLLRVARYLPGAATNPLSARANVRGGRDDETMVWFDGVPLFEPFHFKDYSAVLGILDPAAADRLDFYSGVFPVRYGDRLSAVMDVQPRAVRGGMHHEIGLSLLSAHVLSAGEANWRDRPVRWLASNRSSVTQRIAQALDRDELEPEFSDLLLRGEIEQGDWTHTLGVLALNDELRFTDSSAAGDETARARYRDGSVWLRAAHRSDSSRVFELTASATQRRSDRDGELDRPGSAAGTVADARRIASRYLRAEWRDPAAWMLGAEWIDMEARYAHSSRGSFDPLLAGLFGRPASFSRDAALVASGERIAAYGSRLWVLDDRWRFDLGLRLDSREYRSDAPGRLSGVDLSPRVAVEHQFDAATVLRVSVGRATQGMRPDELDVADGDNAYAAVQRADQLVLAIERRMGDAGSLRAEAYRKDVSDPIPHDENLLDPVSLLPELEVDRSRLRPDSARLYGIELSGRIRLSPAWSTWLTYSWSEANERIAGQWVPRSWNQLHSVAGGAAWARGPWELSANLLWHSGWRRTRVPDGAQAAVDVVRNAAQWDDYASLDLRATWTRPLSLGRLRVWADVTNSTQRLNPCCAELFVERASGTALVQSREKGWVPRYVIVGATWELP
jgi:outer membrane receptor protein involved in Fe transport